MCRSSFKNQIPAPPASNKLLLYSLNCYREDSNGQTPSNAAKLTTIFAFAAFLVLLENTWRYILLSYSNLHPLLEDERNRFILSRHLGVDGIGCLFVACYGYQGMYLLKDMMDAVFRGKNSMPKAYDNRLFKYHPEAARAIVFFLGYQIKNSYDTVIWNDGALFVIHHILAFSVAWGALFPGSAFYYGTFYLGFSEASTTALCLLSNFDDEFGVKGLGDAFPLAKAVLGGIFAALFIICRVVLWSTVSYYYVKDVTAVLKTDDPRLVGRKAWFKFTRFALGILSILQIIWLGEIFRIGYVELKNMGFI